MSEQNVNTINSQIDLDILTSTDVTKLANDVGELSKQVADLGKALSTANVSAQSFESNLSDSIKASLDKIRNQDFRMNGESIEESLSKTLAEFILARDFIIDSTNADIVITPTTKFWSAYRTAISNVLQEKVENINLTASGAKALNFNPMMTTVFRKLSSRMEHLLENELDVTVDDLEKNPEKKKRKGCKLDISSDSLQKIMNTLSDTIVNQLADPSNIHVADIPKLNISAGSLSGIVSKIEQSIGDISRYLNLDAIALKDIPKIDPKLDQFDVKIQNLLKQVVEVQKALTDLNPEIEPEKMKLVVQTLNTLNNSVADTVSNIIHSVAQQINQAPLNSINYSTLSESLGKLDNVVQESIKSRMAQAEQDLLQAMGVARTNVDGKEVYLTNMKELNKRLVEATKSAVANLGSDDFKLDTDIVKVVMTQLAKQFDVIAESTTRQAVSDVVQAFLSINDDIADRFRTLVDEYNQIVLSVAQDSDVKPIEISVDHEKLKSQFQTEIIPIIEGYVNNMKFKPLKATRNNTVQVDIPQPIREKISKVVSDLVSGQVTTILESLGAQIDSEPPSETITKLKALVESDINAITSLVIEKSKMAINTVLGSDFSTMPTDTLEDAQLTKVMVEQSSHMVSQYTEQVKNAFGGVVEATASIQSMVLSVQETVLQGVKKMLKSITFSTQGITEVQLDNAVERALKSVQKAVLASIRQWEYDSTITPLSQDTISKTLSSKMEKLQAKLLKEAINSTLDAVGQTNLLSSEGASSPKMVKTVASASKKFIDKIMQQMTSEITDMVESLASDNLISINQSSIQQLVEPIGDILQKHVSSQVNVIAKSLKDVGTTTSFKTTNLNAEVKKRIAQELETSVKQLTTNIPKLDGEDDLNYVMKHNIQLLIDKFNDAVLSNTNTSMQELEQAIKTVSVETDTSVATMLGRRMQKMQTEINQKIKEMLKVQFDALSEQIKDMRVYPISIGYKPPANVTNAYSRPPKANPNYGSRTTGSYNGRASVAYANVATPFSIVSNNRISNGGYNPGGDTHSFAGSIVNTMRYMLAGSLMGIPMMMLHRGFQATKDFDYNMTKAQQNFLMKDPEMREVAIEHIYSTSTEAEIKELNSNSQLLNETIEKTAYDLKKMAKDGAKEMVTSLANAFSQSISDASLAYSVASRNIDNPYDAQLFTKEVLKLKAVEEMDIETSALGLQSIQAQWGLDVVDLEKATNMLIKTATLSSVTAEDLLETQSTAGSLFMNNLAGMTKEDALATSFALSSLFTQSTAKSGSEGGTYFKSVLEKPFESGSTEVLQQYAQYEGFESLNPYKEDGVTRKDYLELLGAIIDASDKLSDKGQTNLFEELFPGRYTGSATAINELVSNMKEELKTTATQLQAEGALPQNGEITAYDTMQAYIDKISTATEDEILNNIAGMQTTWDMTMSRTQSIAESMGMNLIENYKDEFTISLTYLNSFMRSVQNNADAVADATLAIGKVVTSIAGAHLLKTGIQKLNTPYFQSSSGQKFFTQSDADKYDDLILQSRANEVQKRANANQRVRLAQELQDKQLELSNATATRDSAVGVYNNMQQSGADKPQLQAQGSKISKAEAEASALRKEIKRLEKQLNALDRSDKTATQSMERLDAVMREMTGSTVLLDVKFDQLELGLADAGMDTLEFNRRLHELRKGFDSGKLSSDKFEKNLVELGNKADMTKQETLDLKHQIDSLNRALATGRVDATQYALALSNIRASDLGKKASASGTGGGNSKASLLTTILGGSAIATKVGSTSKATEAGGFIAKLAGVPVLGKLFSGTGKLASKLPKISSLFTKLKFVPKVLGKFTKGIPMLGAILTAIEIIPNITDGILSRGNTLGENMQIKAQHAKSFSQSMMKIKDSSNIILKGIRSLLGLWDVLMNGLNNLLGGNKLSFSQSWDALKKAVSGDMSKEEYAKWLDDNIGYDNMALEANKQLTQENLEAIDPLRDASTGKIKDTVGDGSYEMTLEDMQTLISNRTANLDDKLSINDNNASKQRLNLLLQGFSESSSEVQEVIRDNLSNNNKILEETISYLKEYLPKLAEGSAKDFLTAQITDLEVAKLQNDVDIQQTYESVYDNIMNKYNDSTAKVEAQYGIKESNAIISGYKDDSTVVKQVGIAKNRALINQINDTQSQLQSALSNFSAGSEMYEKIGLQILQLEAEEKNLLATISKDLKEMSEVSTFNLPSGITPITYWEAMTKNNTHKNMTVKAGDTNINITIDKMSGSEEDIEKMATTIDQVVKDATKNSTYAFDSNVKSGMGYSYYPHTRV